MTEEYETVETVDDNVDSSDVDAGEDFDVEVEVDEPSVDDSADSGNVDWWGGPTEYW